MPTFFVLTAKAGNLKTKCKNLVACAQSVSKLTGKEYLYPEKFTGKVRGTEGIELTAKNADTLYSYILNENGYTRILLEDGKTFRIISARDVRYNPVPKVTASYDKGPALPQNVDYHMMTYKMKHPIVSTYATRSLRPFMSRYGRIIDNRINGTLIVQDTALNLKRLYGLIRAMDEAPSREVKKGWKLAKKNSHEIKLQKAKNCGDKS